MSASAKSDTPRTDKLLDDITCDCDGQFWQEDADEDQVARIVQFARELETALSEKTAECERLRRDTYYLNKQHGELTEAQQRALLDEHKRAEAEKSRADNAERKLAEAEALRKDAERLKFQYSQYVKTCEAVGLGGVVSYEQWISAIDAARSERGKE